MIGNLPSNGWLRWTVRGVVTGSPRFDELASDPVALRRGYRIMLIQWLAFTAVIGLVVWWMTSEVPERRFSLADPWAVVAAVGVVAVGGFALWWTASTRGKMLGEPQQWPVFQSWLLLRFAFGFTPVVFGLAYAYFAEGGLTLPYLIGTAGFLVVARLLWTAVSEVQFKGLDMP